MATCKHHPTTGRFFIEYEQLFRKGCCKANKNSMIGEGERFTDPVNNQTLFCNHGEVYKLVKVDETSNGDDIYVADIEVTNEPPSRKPPPVENEEHEDHDRPDPNGPTMVVDTVPHDPLMEQLPLDNGIQHVDPSMPEPNAEIKGQQKPEPTDSLMEQLPFGIQSVEPSTENKVAQPQSEPIDPLMEQPSFPDTFGQSVAEPNPGFAPVPIDPSSMTKPWPMSPTSDVKSPTFLGLPSTPNEAPKSQCSCDESLLPLRNIGGQLKAIYASIMPQSIKQVHFALHRNDRSHKILASILVAQMKKLFEGREFATYVSLYEYKADGSATTYYQWNDQCPQTACEFANIVYNYQQLEAYEGRQAQNSGFTNGLNLAVETAHEIIGKSFQQCPQDFPKDHGSLQILVFLGPDIDVHVVQSKNQWFEHLQAGGYLTFITSGHETYAQATALRNNLTQIYPQLEHQISTIFMPLLRIKGGMQCLPNCICENQSIQTPKYYNSHCSKFTSKVSKSDQVTNFILGTKIGRKSLEAPAQIEIDADCNENQQSRLLVVQEPVPAPVSSKFDTPQLRSLLRDFNQMVDNGQRHASHRNEVPDLKTCLEKYGSSVHAVFQCIHLLTA